MSWEIFLGLAALVSFGVAVITPLIKLNTSITKLNCAIDTLNDKMARSEKANENLSSRLDRQGEILADHERRITHMECADAGK